MPFMVVVVDRGVCAWLTLSSLTQSDWLKPPKSDWIRLDHGFQHCSRSVYKRFL